MVKVIQIELLKSKRTKSFMISFVIMLVAVVWSLLAASRSINSPKLRTMGLFFNNLQAIPVFLPIATCLFVSRIVSNEKDGNTLKLQNSNNIKLMTVFNSKLFFSNVVFFVLNIFQILIVYLDTVSHDIEAPLSNLALQLIGLTMSSFSLLTIFLYLAMILEKQGVLLGIGFLSGFLGIIMSETSKWLNLFFPFGGSSFLALYRIKVLQSGEYLDYVFVWDKTVPLNFILYFIYCILIYFMVRYLLLKKQGENYA